LFRRWRDPVYWDELARFYFPLSFAVFNVFYWGYYLLYHKVIKPVLFPESSPT